MPIVNASFARALLRHLAVLLLVSLPLALIVFAATKAIRGEGEGSGFGGILLDLTALYPGLALFLGLGAIPYTIGLALASRWGAGNTRLAALLALPLALIPWLLLPARFLVSQAALGFGVAVGLLALAMLAQAPGAATPPEASSAKGA
jgi:hypothetical protein